MNNDPNIHGIIVQMPLDSDNPIDSHLVTDSVSPEKDIDGYGDFIYNSRTYKCLIFNFFFIKQTNFWLTFIKELL